MVMGGAVLALAITGLTYAQGPAPETDVSTLAVLGTAFTYQGRLTDGGSPADGPYDLRFRLYDAVSDGAQVGSTVTRGDVAVREGLFTVALDFGDVFDGTAMWMEVAVRPGSSTDAYAPLAPRQTLTAAPYALYAANVDAHNHWGQTWSGMGTGLTLSGGDTGVDASGSDYGVHGYSTSTSGTGVEGIAGATSGDTVGVAGYTKSPQGSGVEGAATVDSGNAYGVYGNSSSTDGRGVYGYTYATGGTTYGVYGESKSTQGHGVYGEATATSGATCGVWGVSKSTSGIGVSGEATATSGPAWGVVGQSDSTEGGGVYGSGAIGVYAAGHGGTKDKAALQAANGNPSTGMAAYIHNGSNYHTAHFANDGAGGVLFLQNNGNAAGAGGGDFITAVNHDGSDQQFRVESSGEAFSDGGWSGHADFAELIATEDDPAAYQPGDVLVISIRADRSAALSSEPYSTLVLGVYSQEPGFVGSLHPMEGQRDDEIPAALVGIVPCKVSAENGPIRRGDLLVTSSTPGHAMRADDAPAGTILGKALERLEEGTGIIQVLVTLQ